MGRSERYIPPTKEELKRLRQAEKRARELERERVELLRGALNRLKKADLVELALRLAQEGKANEWLVDTELALNKPVELIVHDVQVAMSIATRVDERRLNYNFDYDWRAYDAVRRGLEQLIEKQALEQAKELALQLMAQGSYQIECSDEGLMQEDIESCLKPVIAAVGTSTGAAEWAQRMLERDRIGCVCDRELTRLASSILDDQ